MDLFEDFSRTVQTDEFKEWEKKQHEEDEKRLHCDLRTRDGRISALLDKFDRLGFIVCVNGKRDENGALIYDENGNPVLMEGETEAQYIDRAGISEKLKR